MDHILDARCGIFHIAEILNREEPETDLSK